MKKLLAVSVMLLLLMTPVLATDFFSKIYAKGGTLEVNGEPIESRNTFYAWGQTDKFYLYVQTGKFWRDRGLVTGNMECIDWYGTHYCHADATIYRMNPVERIEPDYFWFIIRNDKINIFALKDMRLLFSITGMDVINFR